MKNVYVFLFLSLGLLNVCFGQQDVTTLGISLKPIFPTEVFGSTTSNFEDDTLVATLKQENGFIYGFVARHGLTKRFSLEAGINVNNQNYRIQATQTQDGANWDNPFRSMTFEIPLSLLVFVPINDQFFVNASAGLNNQFFPSDIKSANSEFFHQSFRNSWYKPALLINTGVEFRTKKSGYFYVGASYKLPYKKAYTTLLVYGLNANDGIPERRTFTTIKANYFTIDFRYFFHQDPEKKVRKNGNSTQDDIKKRMDEYKKQYNKKAGE